MVCQGTCRTCEHTKPDEVASVESYYDVEISVRSSLLVHVVASGICRESDACEWFLAC